MRYWQAPADEVETTIGQRRHADCESLGHASRDRGYDDVAEHLRRARASPGMKRSPSVVMFEERTIVSPRLVVAEGGRLRGKVEMAPTDSLSNSRP